MPVSWRAQTYLILSPGTYRYARHTVGVQQVFVEWINECILLNKKQMAKSSVNSILLTKL